MGRMTHFYHYNVLKMVFLSVLILLFRLNSPLYLINRYPQLLNNLFISFSP